MLFKNLSYKIIVFICLWASLLSQVASNTSHEATDFGTEEEEVVNTRYASSENQLSSKKHVKSSIVSMVLQILNVVFYWAGAYNENFAFSVFLFSHLFINFFSYHQRLNGVFFGDETPKGYLIFEIGLLIWGVIFNVAQVKLFAKGGSFATYIGIIRNFTIALLPLIYLILHTVKQYMYCLGDTSNNTILEKIKSCMLLVGLEWLFFIIGVGRWLYIQNIADIGFLLVTFLSSQFYALKYNDFLFDPKPALDMKFSILDIIVDLIAAIAVIRHNVKEDENKDDNEHNLDYVATIAVILFILKNVVVLLWSPIKRMLERRKNLSAND